MILSSSKYSYARDGINAVTRYRITTTMNIYGLKEAGREGIVSWEPTYNSLLEVTMNRYSWPASGLNKQDMELLYYVREKARPRIPISKLVAEAVRRVYRQAFQDSDMRKTLDLKVAA